jgi:hypothetical protein
MDTGEWFRRMPYRLTVFREMIDGIARKQVTGQLLGLRSLDDIFGIPLRLMLEDGRNLEFFVADPGGTIAVLNSDNFRDFLPPEPA